MILRYKRNSNLMGHPSLHFLAQVKQKLEILTIMSTALLNVCSDFTTFLARIPYDMESHFYNKVSIQASIGFCET